MQAGETPLERAGWGLGQGRPRGDPPPPTAGPPVPAPEPGEACPGCIPWQPWVRSSAARRSGAISSCLPPLAPAGQADPALFPHAAKFCAESSYGSLIPFALWAGSRLFFTAVLPPGLSSPAPDPMGLVAPVVPRTSPGVKMAFPLGPATAVLLSVFSGASSRDGREGNQTPWDPACPLSLTSSPVSLILFLRWSRLRPPRTE